VAADSITPDARAGDFAQAMMDLGSGTCTTRAPKCLLCPIREHCEGFKQGAPERLPVKAKKTAKPQRYGTIFWLERDGQVLLVRRPDTGLLGGMRAFPTGPWGDAPPGFEDAPAQADWRMPDETVAHGFTHFDLQLTLAVATVEAHQPRVPTASEWWPIDDLDTAGLPTVFAKAGKTIRNRAIRRSA
jgi:A/G-specific adenine glycosylase